MRQRSARACIRAPIFACRIAYPSIRGDRDRILLELYQTGPSSRGDFQQLERKHFDWMPQILNCNGEVFLCHGTSRNDGSFLA
jgi:hypothetical protein